MAATQNIPKQNLIRIAVCAAVLIILLLFLIYPNSRKLSRLSNSVSSLEREIKQQKVLLPIYSQMRKRLTKEESEQLETPDTQALGLNQMDEVQLKLRSIISDAGMDAVAVSPDPRSLSEEHNLLRVECIMRGEFFEFREVLIELGAIPYLQHVSRIGIQEVPGSREFRVTAWIILKKSSS